MSSLEDESGIAPPDSDLFEDPLADPLAIDDFNGTEILNNSCETETVSKDSSEKIIFVDIEKLKGTKNSKRKTGTEISPRKPVKSANDTLSLIDNKPIVTENFESNNELLDCKKDIDINKLSDDLADIIPDAENELLPNELSDLNKHRHVDNNFVNNTSSETETEETFDPPVLLENEELRCSDGSDSGLGLDTLRSVSAIERDLAKLTPSKSTLKRRSDGTLDEEEEPKKPKRSINFGNVTVYYFPRVQGFGCIPSQGGSTLGMTSRHSCIKNFTLTEHAAEQRRQHRQQLNELNPLSSSSDDSNTEEEPSENSGSEADSEVYGFLQPISARQRRSLLKAAGVRKIDSSEKDECRLIRISRETCGCSCRRYCDPDTCECSQNGIKCQVDRLKPNEYPCGCVRDECANVNGRVEFNPGRVKTHYIHTIMRLGLEKKPETTSESTPMLTGYHSSKWLPHVRMSQTVSHCDYNNFMYNNNMTAASHYQNKLSNGNVSSASSVIHNGVLHNGESLDLHYAFRDDYGTANGATNGESSGSFNGQSTNEYYLNYNYMTNGNHYQNSYLNGMSSQTQSSGQQPHHHSHPQQHYQGYHQYIGDNSLFSNSHLSSYVSTQNGFSSDHVAFNGAQRGNSTDYLNQPQMPQLDAINALVSNSNSTVNNSDNNRSIVTPTPIYMTPATDQTDNNPISNGTVVDSNRTENFSNSNNSSSNQENQNQNNENLCEIIKKSIVETVTA